MPNIEIVKYKLRRGTKAQQLVSILDQGELAYTIDTKRVFVGTGTLSGGNVVGNKIHQPLNSYSSLTSTIAEVGDLVVANNLLYQLINTTYSNISSWRYIGPSIDQNILEFNSNNLLSIKNFSISSSKINPASVKNGLKIDSGNLELDYDSIFFGISSNKVTMLPNSISETEISSSVLSSGLVGGSGNKLTLSIDPQYFYFNAGRLSLSAIPSGSISFETLNPSWIGRGLVYDNTNKKIYSNITNIDNTLSKDLSGVIGLQSYVPALTSEMSYLEVDEYGRVSNQGSSIFDVLTGMSNLNSSNSLSSIFNGSPSQTLSGGIPGLPITTFQAVSAYNGNTQIITLSSAGFILFQGNTTSRLDGKSIGRFAIPIFAY
jgi:hypothetical protein